MKKIKKNGKNIKLDSTKSFPIEHGTMFKIYSYIVKVLLFFIFLPFTSLLLVIHIFYTIITTLILIIMVPLNYIFPITGNRHGAFIKKILNLK